MSTTLKFTNRLRPLLGNEEPPCEPDVQLQTCPTELTGVPAPTVTAEPDAAVILVEGQCPTHSEGGEDQLGAVQHPELVRSEPMAKNEAAADEAPAPLVEKAEHQETVAGATVGCADERSDQAAPAEDRAFLEQVGTAVDDEGPGAASTPHEGEVGELSSILVPDLTQIPWWDWPGDLSDLPVRPAVPRPALRGPEPTDELLDGLQRLRLLTGGVGLTAPAVILSAGGGIFAVELSKRLNRATVVHPERRVIEAATAEPLASGGSVVRTLKSSGPRALRVSDQPIRTGLTYRCAPLVRTGLPASSFGLVVIEQAHEGDLAGLMVEARRLAKPGAAVVLVGFMLPQLVPSPKAKDAAAVPMVNDLMREFANRHVVHSLTADERQLLTGYREVAFPFEERPEAAWNSDLRGHSDFRRRMAMRAKWNPAELAEYIATWPGVRRVEQVSSPQQVHFWNFQHALKKAWGSAKRRRELRWKVMLRVGFASAGMGTNMAIREGREAACPVEEQGSATEAPPMLVEVTTAQQP